MIRINNLEKKFGRNSVLSELDLEAGGIHGLMGRNGVGKSTLLQLIAGQLKKTSGDIEVFGHSPFDNAKVMDRLSLTGVDVAYPSEWKIKNILIAGRLRYPQWDQHYADTLVEEFSLGGKLNAKYGKLSRGERAMVGITMGLASGTELTLLDEPYVGLDVHNTRVFYRHLLELSGSGRTFIIATHHIEDAAKILDSAFILGRQGRINAHIYAEHADDYIATHNLGNSLRTPDFSSAIEHLLEVS